MSIHPAYHGKTLSCVHVNPPLPHTDAAIRALKPEAKRYSRTDERGLVIEVFPTSGMLWHYRYRVNGKPERATLGRYPALSLRQALVAQAFHAREWLGIPKGVPSLPQIVGAVLQRPEQPPAARAR